MIHYHQQNSLYDPSTEHAACGVGFVANLKGNQTHKIVTDALQIMANLEHRGACGCDPGTSDGVGLLVQTPHGFLKDAASDANIRLPDQGEYATGLVFLPPDQHTRNKIEDALTTYIKEEGQEFLGWREVPHNSETAGRVALSVEPIIRQLFIGRGTNTKDDATFERKLYIIRKRAENTARQIEQGPTRYFHIPSLSQHTLIYKGLLLANRVADYFTDLTDTNFKSAFGLVHQRYSTNTLPTWDLAQPFRFLCHNGEINTLRGNVNWLHAREKLFESPLFGDDMAKILPIVTPGASDSAILDNAVELLYHTGRSLPHCIAMLIPEAWENNPTMSDTKRAFYDYHSCIMEPWDGPASVAFTNGKLIGAVLDRNGLRPSRFMITKDQQVIMASETGVLDVAPENVEQKGRLQPGRMFLVDLNEGRIVPDAEIKESLAAKKPYRTWLNWNMVSLTDIPRPPKGDYPPYNFETLQSRQKVFGYTREDLQTVLAPMGTNGAEPLGSMGDDTPLAVLSNREVLLYDYFKQLFAQVTNPPLDAIREEMVTSTTTSIGMERDLFEEAELHCRQLRIKHLVLDNKDLRKIESYDDGYLKAKTIPMLFRADGKGETLEQAIESLCQAATVAIDEGHTILILSDRGVSAQYAAIPALLAAAAVHHHLIRQRTRTKCGIIIESAEPREVHHFAMLVAFGIGAVNPYLALATLADMHNNGLLGSDLTLDQVRSNYAKAINKGVVKVISKMGISTLDGYRGAQIVEAVGLNNDLIDKYFTGTPSRIGGIGLNEIAQETLTRHARGFNTTTATNGQLANGGKYRWRRGEEFHNNNPQTIAKLQQAVRTNDAKTFAEFSRLSNDRSKQLGTLRGLLEFNESNTPLPIEEVEPAAEIVKRFKTGAMSFGSLSFEAHANLAIAMNRLGGKSNTGEGGEDPIRFKPFATQDNRREKLSVLSPWADENVKDGDSLRSAVKQIASGRFGVTSHYLVSADELQIKMAQGAKPGEGGQLPGHKVNDWIGRTRHSTPGVGLISPPPHHDIYSIEDLAQLIYDLRCANNRARISVKLVAELGVGTVAAGVAKAKADVVLISGHDGGTGASPLTSIKHTGLPWELGLAEAQQVLVNNGLRNRIVIEADGQLRTGRDVAIACLLGAEEFGFATAPLIASGCVMMRKCHLNTCPVGVATQDPELRKKFAGKPEHVINYMFFVAEELRQIMATLGFKTLHEMIGRTDKLRPADNIDHWKARSLDLKRILVAPPAADTPTRYELPQEHDIDQSLDATTLLELAKPAIEKGQPVFHELAIRNTNRTVGTLTGSEITRAYGAQGLPPDTVRFKFNGSAGQSFAAFCPTGMTMEIEGDANDYFGKGLCGAKLIVYPPKASTFVPRDNIIIGNVAFYGATSGEAYVRGMVGERFCVRNSGANVVVESVGDHGCEYMTGGRVVILGDTGRNFAAGMTGGIAYVLDLERNFAETKCNPETVFVESLTDRLDIVELRAMISNYVQHTDSPVGRRILDRWREYVHHFVKVIPKDYKRVLQERTNARKDGLSETRLEVAHG